MFLSARLRRLTLCRLIGSQWRRDHRQPDRSLAPPENVAFEGRHGLFGWPKAADSPIGWRASSACRATSGLEALSQPSTAVQFSLERARRAGLSCDTPTARQPRTHAGTRAGRRVNSDGNLDAMNAGEAHRPLPAPPCDGSSGGLSSLRSARRARIAPNSRTNTARSADPPPKPLNSPFPPRRSAEHHGCSHPPALRNPYARGGRSGRRSLMLLKATRAAPPLA